MKTKFVTPMVDVYYLRKKLLLKLFLTNSKTFAKLNTQDIEAQLITLTIFLRL